MPVFSYAAEYQRAPAFRQLSSQSLLPAPDAFPEPVPAAFPAGAISGFPACAFSGKADISALITAAINASGTSVDAAIYGITLRNVAEALVAAKARGVKVRVIMNESHVFNRQTPELRYLIDNKINIRSLRGLGKYGIMHNKLAVFDSRVALTGSFNWTLTANNANYENAVFSEEADVVAGYMGYFEWMWGYTRPISAGPGSEMPADAYGPPPEDPKPSVSLNGSVFPGYSFSPAGETEKNLVKAMNASNHTIDAAVFSFYSAGLARALLDAKARGVKVRVVVDRVQASQSEIPGLLIENGISFKWSQGYNGKGVMHDKFAVFDGRMLATGSFNWSANAQNNNFENVFYTSDAGRVKAFASEFEDIFSGAYAPAADEIERIWRDIPRTPEIFRTF